MWEDRERGAREVSALVLNGGSAAWSRGRGVARVALHSKGVREGHGGASTAVGWQRPEAGGHGRHGRNGATVANRWAPATARGGTGREGADR
jgi:hypothetical protein